MNETTPGPEAQIQFLRNVQRLFDEGSFVASYKFALLHALVDLAVIYGDDSGAPLVLRTRDIAAQMIELYWQQALPFPTMANASDPILRQNTGRQATIISVLVAAHAECEGVLTRLKLNTTAWDRLVTRVDQTLREMPLWKLQTVGDERLEFLYENVDRGNAITLKPGVSFCLRTYYGLLRDLIQGAWIQYVRRLNASRLGDVTDLAVFMFDRRRSSLHVYRPILADAQEGRCFYCRKALSRVADVDHFIPWSRYPSDLGHNFVLAHGGCNTRKSDHLASEEHLAAWHERNTRHGKALGAVFADNVLPHDLSASIRIAAWAYGNTERVGGQVWVEGRVLRHLGPGWRRLLSAG